MSDDLAARIEAALTRLEKLATLAVEGSCREWQPHKEDVEGWVGKSGHQGWDAVVVGAGDEADTVVAETVGQGHEDDRYAVASLIAAVASPASVLRQIAGMREILDGHSDVSDDNHAGVCACEFDWPCPTVRSLASMLGVDEGGK